MLETTSRRLLFDALRPPLGHTLDRAIGTTFSLDLLALLTAPLAFTFFEWAEEGGPQQAHPLALLEALRRYAGRISLFCQAGRIAIPRTQRPLFGYLEDSVVEVTAPHDAGVFHPKIWLLRYIAPDTMPHYRLLCLSRNLTFDRSWDTALVLEGRFLETPEPDEHERIRKRNGPLQDFLMALPRLSSRLPAERIRHDISLLCEELDRVDFLPPDGFHDLSFWPLGLRENMPIPFQDARMDQLLIVAPYVSNGLLKYLATRARSSILVSRAEELAKCNSTELERFEEVHVLSSQADMEETDATAPDTLSGLHAKAYVADAGWNAHVWTGSANATVAAFKQNVEFLVELRGKKSQCGVDQILGRNTGKNGLLSLLEPYDLGTVRRTENAAEVLFDELTDRLRNTLAKALLAADVTDEVDADGVPAYGITLRCIDGEDGQREAMKRLADAYGALKQITVESFTCWPISRTEREAVAVTIVWPQDSSTLPFARFCPLSVETLTSFFAFRLKAQLPTGKAHSDGSPRTFPRSCSFVLNIPLNNPPPDRQQRLLRSLLTNRQDVLRFLRLLLAGEGTDVSQLLGMAVPQNETSAPTNMTAGSPLEFPLLEALVRALHDSPDKLDDIQRLVTDLASTPDGRDLLPEGFHEIWEPVRAIRDEIACKDLKKKPSQRAQGR